MLDLRDRACIGLGHGKEVEKTWFRQREVKGSRSLGPPGPGEDLDRASEDRRRRRDEERKENLTEDLHFTSILYIPYEE